MANEISVNSSLVIRKGSLLYQSRPNFTTNLFGLRGPTPGAQHVTVKGIDVSFSELLYPGGICCILNVDPNNYVNYGVRDTTSNRYWPLGELLPGEGYIMRLSRVLGQDFGTGTGSTASGQTCVFHMKAPNGAADVIVEGFDA